MRVPQAADSRTTAVAAPTHASRRRDRRSGSPVCIRLLEMSGLGGIYIFERIGRGAKSVSTQVRRGSNVTIPGASRFARKEISLADQVAVVTGGGSGIGAATCRRLAEHGAAVAVLDVDHTSARRVGRDLSACDLAARD